MKTLDEFNSERMKTHSRVNDQSPRSNGIACPICGMELMDSCPMVTLTSNPPQKNVHCPECDYHGFRVA
jgi:DNA-directed RNA polymerase subunit RPC12/RpoP